MGVFLSGVKLDEIRIVIKTIIYPLLMQLRGANYEYRLFRDNVHLLLIWCHVQPEPEFRLPNHACNLESLHELAERESSTIINHLFAHLWCHSNFGVQLEGNVLTH